MTNHFNMKNVYDHIRGDDPTLNWKGLFHNILAWPRAILPFWITSHNRLPTKVRLKRFGMVDDDKCIFCPAVETTKHLVL